MSRVLVAAALVGLLTGCAAASTDRPAPPPPASDLAAVAGAAGPAPLPLGPPRPLRRLRGQVHEPDLVVVGESAISERLVRRIGGTPGVRATEALALASAPVDGRVVTLAAVDPATYRRFTPAGSARTLAVWQRVSEGDIAVTPALADELGRSLTASMPLGNGPGAVGIRIGAEAALTPQVDAVVTADRGAQFGMVADNALLLSTTGDTAAVSRRVGRLLGDTATVSSLTAVLPDEGRQTATLTGSSVAAAVGSFGYRYFEDGTVEPDPRWVGANLVTGEVPVLGTVTCHRVMLPQLQGALAEVVALGLAASIDPSDFGGCYVPRFIESDPSKGLSLHTWGIAVDLNVAGNQRGTAGAIDRRVVATFKRWGFAWGGDWAYTDPMHFELAALVRAR